MGAGDYDNSSIFPLLRIAVAERQTEHYFCIFRAINLPARLVSMLLQACTRI